MKAEKYFEKYGKIYGVSRKYEFGKWNAYAVEFDSMEDAEKWLNTEEYDFRERELVSKTAAIKECRDVRKYNFA